MTRRLHPIGQHSGFGTGAEPEVTALMGATAARPLAHLALTQIESRFSCRAPRLVWELRSTSGIPLRHACPESAPLATDASLIDAAFTAGAEVRAGLPGSDGCRIASVLGRGGARARAVLVTEWPTAAALEQDEAEWRAYLGVLAPRFVDVLDLTEQAGTIEGLKKS